MRKLENRQITTNFSLHEFVEGSVMPAKGIEMNWVNISELDESNMLTILTAAESLRSEVNAEFRHKNNNKVIRFIISSGFRCNDWEKSKDRGINTRHSRSLAVDLVPSNCSAELAVEIIQFVYNKYSHRVKGWKGGFAIKKPTYKKGKIDKIGFIHIDRLPANTRWFY